LHERPVVKWLQVRNYFLRRNYEIRSSGGDKIIIAPKVGDKKRSRNTVRIGHKCCNRPGDEMYDAYLSAIKRAFGVTRRQILNG